MSKSSAKVLIMILKNRLTFYASLFLQIPVLTAVFIIVLVQFGVPQSRDFFWVIMTLIHLSLLPLLYGAFVYKNKIISNADITERRERVLPFFIISFIYGVYLLATVIFGAPVLFKILGMHYFLLALFLSIVTIFWKISVHTAGVTQFVALLALLIGNQALIFFPLIILTGWLRIQMKSHDIQQVLAGIAVSLASTFIATKISFL